MSDKDLLSHRLGYTYHARVQKIASGGGGPENFFLVFLVINVFHKGPY